MYIKLKTTIKPYFKASACALLLSLSVTLSAQTMSTHAFVQRDSTLYLDVYRPQNPRADKAAVMAVFGGGFVVGNRDDAYQRKVAEVLTQRGFTVISPDYRLGLKDTATVKKHSSLFKIDDLFQYCIDIATEDCAAAVRWVCAHAAELDIDTSRLVLTGSSAGAIAVLQLDYCRANTLPAAKELPSGWKPAAVVPYSGGIMCHKRDLKYKTPPAPTMLMHGVKDKIVHYKHFGLPFCAKLYGAKTVSKRMKKQGIPHWIIRFEGVGHEVAAWLPNSADLFCAFVDQVLAGRISSLDATMTDSELKPTKWTTMTMLQMYKEVDN
ncbi:MAG: alpha/beta hydrolase [Bacteroidales bacterium]|nr:alpha/beta hydrolase [Bacteroidales bacterium]